MSLKNTPSRLNQTFCISTKIDAHRATKLCSWKNDHFHLWFIFSWQGDWFIKIKKIEIKQKLTDVLMKARKHKKKELLSWERLRWGGNKNDFPHCLGPTLLSEKSQNQSQLPDTSSSLFTSLLSSAEWRILTASSSSGPLNSCCNVTY